MSGCGHMNENGPHPWNWTVCGRKADERSPKDRPRCTEHLPNNLKGTGRA